MNILSEFKDLLRMNDYNGDRWAVAMSAFFDVAAHIYEAGDVPKEWGFLVGWGGNHLDQESILYDFFCALDYNSLVLIGCFLKKLCSLLELAGQSY